MARYFTNVRSGQANNGGRVPLETTEHISITFDTEIVNKYFGNNLVQ
jgi:hypothetical protein